MEVYWTEIEYRYSKHNPDRSNAKGGFVYAFVIAADAREAIAKFANAMADEALIVERIKYVSPYGDTSWEKEEDQIRFSNLVKRALPQDRVIFDEFFAYLA